MVKTYAELYLQARNTLLSAEDAQSAGLIARNLLSSITGISQAQLISASDQPASEDVCAKMDFAVARILAGEPLAYVLGQWDFYGMTLLVDKNVLIPRDDTCAVTSLAINQCLFLGKNPRVLDLCTGSGCIGLAIAEKVKDARVTLADISPEALAVAKKNINDTKLSGRVSAMQVDAMKPPAPFLGKFDLIVSNPPYITTEEMEQLPRSVADYEPHLALHGGDDGLDFYRAITENFATALKPKGYLCFEFGKDQGESVCRILIENGFEIIERSRDYHGIERAVLAQYIRKEDV